MTVEKKEPFSFEWVANVLKMSRDEKLVRSYDFDKVPKDQDVNFLKLGKQTKLGNFKASAKKLGADPVALMDEGFELLCTGAWAFEREGIVRAPEYLIVLVTRLMDISRDDAIASLKDQKDTWEAITKAHQKTVDEIKKELATAKAEAVKVDLRSILKA